jgi:hypothetical protein
LRLVVCVEALANSEEKNENWQRKSFYETLQRNRNTQHGERLIVWMFFHALREENLCLEQQSKIVSRQWHSMKGSLLQPPPLSASPLLVSEVRVFARAQQTVLAQLLVLAQLQEQQQQHAAEEQAGA